MSRVAGDRRNAQPLLKKKKKASAMLDIAFEQA